MTLTTRLSVFFLVILAVVLLGFSATLYLLARSHLYRQADDRLQSVLNTLAAAADVDEDGVEWRQRQWPLGQETTNSDICWIVMDDRGHPLDRSGQVLVTDSLANSFLALTGSDPTVRRIRWQDRAWILAQRQLSSPTDGGAATSTLEASNASEHEKKLPAVRIAAAVTLEPVQTSLHSLLAVLCILCATFWLLAAFVGRRVCRRALAPVTRMAATARTIRAADLGQRLPSTGTLDELEELSQAFNGLLDRLHESFQRQQRFTGDASHQLRTPLTAMIGQIEVTLRRGRSPEEYQRTLNLVRGQADRLRQIVEMLLFLARADAEAKLPHLETRNLADWLQEHLRAWSEHPRTADLRMERSDDDSCLAKVHPTLLGQLLDNLLDNACKHSEPGTLITVRLSNQQDSVCLAVEDSGCGICSEDLPHVFEAFYRSSRARQLGIVGVGLGLAVAQRIAVAFGGGIRVTSELGKGSRFLIQLPYAAARQGVEISSEVVENTGSIEREIEPSQSCSSDQIVMPGG